MDRRHVIAGLGVAGLAGAASAQAGREGFTSGGRPVTVEWFPAAGSGRAPAVLLLHGADGLTRGDGYRLAARYIASSGFSVAFVHYLDRTGDRRVAYGRLRQDYPAWAETVGDAVTWLAARPDVDSRRLGIVGISLGAALALETAASDRRIKAVVDYFGPLPERLAGQSVRLPPTLILHGELDPIVPVANAYKIEAVLRDAGTPYEIQVYPGQGHALVGAAQLDAASRTTAFLGRHLREGSSRT